MAIAAPAEGFQAQAAPTPASAPTPAARVTDPGFTFRVYQVEGDIFSIPPIAPDQTPNLDRLLTELNISGDAFGPFTAPTVTEIIAFLQIPRDGMYQFRVASDDGSRLTIGGAVAVDHDGRHGATRVTGAAIRLAAGSHDLRLDHFDSGGARSIRVEWAAVPAGMDDAPEAAFRVLAAPDVQSPRDLTRVTSPGVKAIAGARRPGDMAPLRDVHPGWTMTTLVADDFLAKVGAMVVMPDGRLIVGTFDPLQRDERVLPDIDSKPPDGLFVIEEIGDADPDTGIDAVTARRVATDLYEPAGMCVMDGELYVAHRRGVVRLLDADGDGFFETHELVGAGWEGWNYHQFAMGLEHRDGRFYTALSTAMAPPAWEGMETNAGSNGPMRGGMVEIDPSHAAPGNTRLIAGGFRTPNGTGVLADGTMIVMDNQGTWMSTNQVVEVVPGRFYGHHNWTRFVPKLADRFPDGGHPSALGDRPRTTAAIYLPQNECSNSPTQALLIEDGPFAGQMLMGELTAGGLRRLIFERVGGVLQGAVVRHTQGLSVGVNRLARGTDGSLYLGGMGAGGNWNWRGTQTGLHRLVSNGRTAFEIETVQATPTGFLVRWTRPVDRAWLADAANFTLRSWTYAPTAAYGGPKVGERAERIIAVRPGGDGRSVMIDVEQLRTGRCFHLHADPPGPDGELVRSTEFWYTLNRVPAMEAGSEDASPAKRVVGGVGVGVGILPPPGAVTLIGQGVAPAMGFRGQDFPPPARGADELVASAAAMAVGEGSGDLISRGEFGDARFHIEWFSPLGGEGQRAGNSGVYLQDRYEIQVLGTLPGAALGVQDAGAIYGQVSASRNVSTGPGTWQAYDILFRAARFNPAGEKSADARVSVFWNGALVHDDVAVVRPTGSRAEGGERPAPGRDHPIGPLLLQDHGSDAEGPVRYRNVWIAPLDAAASDPALGPAGPWIDLMARRDLAADWLTCGGQATYAFDGDELVGTTAPNSPNTFLATPERFADFELIYEARVDPRLNSGVQIRSEFMDRATGDEVGTRRGPMTGPQIELDPSDRSWTAGIYEERGRGWLAPLHMAPSARRAFRGSDWNTIRVVARGPVIRTWINGVPATELFDARQPDGHIGFQVHGVGAVAEPMEVRFREARVRSLGQD
ncbi:MAG: family 16 glycoside hydrolase [Phycisphaerales bacterium]